MKNGKLLILCECAILIAMASVLNLISIIKMPMGGSVTLVSMAPIIIISFRRGIKWGVFSAFVFALIQIATGFYPPPTQDILSFVLVILLDYIFAFGVLGFAGILGRGISKNSTVEAAVGAAVAVFLRFICHFLSGILIWKVYAGEQTAFMYSLYYNGSYMGIELIFTTIVIAAISGKKFFKAVL